MLVTRLDTCFSKNEEILSIIGFMAKFLSKNLLEKLWLMLLLLVPIILWILPANFFDDSQVVLCPSRLLFNFECLGCGMTRAVMHLHHLDIENALFYNYGSLIIYPSLGVVWLIWVFKSLFRLGWKTKNRFLRRIAS